MPAAFSAVYGATIDGARPRMTNERAAKVVLGTAGPRLATYSGNAQKVTGRMGACRYHFLTHSKPAKHLRDPYRPGRAEGRHAVAAPARYCTSRLMVSYFFPTVARHDL